MKWTKLVKAGMPNIKFVVWESIEKESAEGNKQLDHGFWSEKIALNSSLNKADLFDTREEAEQIINDQIQFMKDNNYPSDERHTYDIITVYLERSEGEVVSTLTSK